MRGDLIKPIPGPTLEHPLAWYVLRIRTKLMVSMSHRFDMGLQGYPIVFFPQAPKNIVKSKI